MNTCRTDGRLEFHFIKTQQICTGVEPQFYIAIYHRRIYTKPVPVSYDNL